MAKFRRRRQLPHGWRQHGSSGRGAISLCKTSAASCIGWKLSVFLGVFLLSQLGPSSATSAHQLDSVLPLPADPLAVAGEAPVAAGGASAQQPQRQQYARKLLQKGTSQQVRHNMHVSI